MTKATPKNHYDTLRLERHASPQRVRHAYRRMAQKFHPDKHPGNGNSADLMAQINQAYAVLSDPARRAVYDAQLQPQSAPSAGRARAAAAAMQDRFGWAGWLLLAIASIILLTLGYVAAQ
jgi:DnaJ-class molecular chaperone